jgi:hypothetical protein
VTNINRKLFGALTPIAMLAPATGAPAASYGTLHPARHFGLSPVGRHFTAHHAPRSSVEFQRGARHWTDV